MMGKKIHPCCRSLHVGRGVSLDTFPCAIQSGKQGVLKLQEAGSTSPELLDMIRNDRLPLAAYGVPHLTPRLSSLLSRVVLACHQAFGSQTIYRTARSASTSCINSLQFQFVN